MLDTSDHGEAVQRFASAIRSLTTEMRAAGVPAEQLSAAIRLEAAEIARHRAADPEIKPGQTEIVELVRRAHDFIDALLLAGVPEKWAVTALNHAVTERLARAGSVGSAAEWLRMKADQMEIHAAEFGDMAAGF